MESRRLEDRIRQLCASAIEVTDESELSVIFEELRQALKEHGEKIRKMASAKLAAGLPMTDKRKP